jgi:dihydropteroate synthase
MGVVNATPDSFSDGGLHPTTEARVELALDLVGQGATIIDVGGQSGITGVPEVAVEEEIARVVPVVEAIHADMPGLIISVDTYRPGVVEAALASGAAMVNDVSGLLYPDVAKLCGSVGAGLVVMHTRARPKHKVLDPDLYDDVTGDVVRFLSERIEAAVAQGLAPEAIVVDPGPDFAKTPAQTVEMLRGMDRVRALGRPVLLALSRKDFVGAITGRAPAERDPGTLAALGYGVEHGACILRVHDVAGARDYFEVRSVLRGERVLGALEGLSPERYPDGVPSHLSLG